MNSGNDLWWLWCLRSGVTALFATIAVMYPPLTSVLAAYLYGAYVKLDGFALIGLNAGNTTRPWLIIAGLAALISGLAILMWPDTSSVALLYVLAVLAITRGGLEAYHAVTEHSKLWERGLRVATAGCIASFGVVLAAHEPLSREVLVGAFALSASLTSACEFAIGLTQWSRVIRQTSPEPRVMRDQTRVRRPLV